MLLKICELRNVRLFFICHHLPAFCHDSNFFATTATSGMAYKWQIIADTILSVILYRTDFQVDKRALWQIADIRKNLEQEARQNALKDISNALKGNFFYLKDSLATLRSKKRLRKTLWKTRGKAHFRCG